MTAPRFALVAVSYLHYAPKLDTACMPSNPATAVNRLPSDPATAVNWGILGTGGIARSFATGLQHTPGARLAAVGSRTLGSAQAFAAEFAVERAHGSYAALAADPKVEVVYVASPHPGHHLHARLLLEAGKHVLLEKPFTMTAAEAADLRDVARARGRFLMEAMWTRFHPVQQQVRAWLAAGEIGELRQLTCDFGFRADFDPASRLFAPALGGGAVLDVGVYVVSYACWMMGALPDAVASLSVPAPTGVDELSGAILRFPGGRLGVVSCSTRLATPHVARLDGTAGRIIVPDFWHAGRAILERNGQAPVTVDAPFTGNGYADEAIAVQQCLAAGLTECPAMPLDETVGIMAVLEEMLGKR